MGWLILQAQVLCQRPGRGLYFFSFFFCIILLPGFLLVKNWPLGGVPTDICMTDCTFRM